MLLTMRLDELATFELRWPKKGSRVRFLARFGLNIGLKQAPKPLLGIKTSPTAPKIVHGSPFLAIASQKLPFVP